MKLILKLIFKLHRMPDNVKKCLNNSELHKRTFEFLLEKNFKPIESITNFITWKTGSLEASEYLFQELLNHGVIIRPLKANEMPDYVRVSIGTKEEMEHFYKAMNEILPKYDTQFKRV